MPVGFRFRADTSGLDGYADLMRQSKRMVNKVASRTVKKNNRHYLEPIQNADPGPSRHRGQWSTNPAANARARRGYWARVRSGTIRANPTTGAYIRSGRLQRGWRLAAINNQVILFNIYPVIDYVSTFGAIYANGGQPNPGHILTGWPQQNVSLALILVNTMANDVLRGIEASVVASVKSGRYTVVIP